MSTPYAAEPPLGRIRDNSVFIGLVLVTVLSAVQVASSVHGVVLPVPYQNFVTQNRATTQIVVQVLSAIFGFAQFAPICVIINRATRLRIAKRQASLDDLRFWSLLVSRGLGWDLPLKRLLILLVFLLCTLNPAALWAGALTPIQVFTFRSGNATVTSYSNISYIKEYPSEVGNVADQMEVRTVKGMFTYDVGIAFQGALLSTASTATTVDGNPRQHAKFDNTGLVYNGRSYGVGSSSGLFEDGIWNDPHVAGYGYWENGYKAEVDCMYNSSTAFLLRELGPRYPWMYAAEGYMPNSNHILETSTYLAPNPASLFAIGVAAGAVNGTQYLSIAAGSDYGFLNATQCSFNFTPTAFHVNIDKATSRITVTPSLPVDDIDPSNLLAHTSVRQFELISNDQTNLYQSLVGNSFISSIANYNISRANAVALTQESASLAGLTSSLTAMLDDILAAYSSAQLMVGNQTASTATEIRVVSMQVGQLLYICFELILNCVILLIVLEEAIRTRGWRDLGAWDYMDIRNVVISSSRGGQDIAADADGAAVYDRKRDWVDKLTGADDSALKTTVKFESDKGALVLVPKTNISVGRRVSLGQYGSQIELVPRQRGFMSGWEPDNRI